MEVTKPSLNNPCHHGIWKEVDGLESSYKVSTAGLVMHFYKNKRWRVVKPFTERTGYSVARLWLGDGKRKGIRVHRLVATAFIPNPNNYGEINHKNGIKTDNRVGNLEWCDRKYNAEYINVLDPDSNRGENNPAAKLTNAQVLKAYDLAQEGKFTNQQIGEMCGMSKYSVYMIKSGREWSYVTKHVAVNG